MKAKNPDFEERRGRGLALAMEICNKIQTLSELDPDQSGPYARIANLLGGLGLIAARAFETGKMSEETALDIVDAAGALNLKLLNRRLAELGLPIE